MGKNQPSAPDPKQTAAAQTATNVSTATANAYLGNANQITPYGTLNYEKTGMEQVYDPNMNNGQGGYYDVPTFTATTSLSPEAQATFDANMASERNLAQLGADQSARIGELLAEPFDISNEATEARLMELGRSRLDPALDRRREQMETRLANQGISLGSEAYDRAMMGLNEAENDAYNQLMLSGRGQAVQEALLQRQAPINEIIGIASGTQVQNPAGSFVNTNQPQIGTPDVAGMTYAKYQGDLNAYNQRQASLGGLFGTIGTGIMLSDARMKVDVVPVGTLGPFTLHEYRYRFEDATAPKSVGVMAQEVAEIAPDAVHDIGGVLHVDYDRVKEIADATA